MIVSTQSLYKFKRDNNKLKVVPQKASNDAKIFKTIKMKDRNKVDNLDKNDYSTLPINEWSNNKGIYRVHIQTINTEDSRKRIYYLEVENNKLIRQTSTYPKDLSGEVSPFDNSIFKDNKIKISDSDWLKLINFYIIKNPSIGKNKKASTVLYFNIKKHWGDNCWQRGDTLKTRLIATIPNYLDSVKHVETVKDMQRPMKNLKLMKFKDFSGENKICIYDSCSNIFLSIFRHIRNSLAHGRFKFYKFDKKTFLFLEDVDKKYVSARITIEVSLLLKWIDLIKGGK